MTYSGSNGKIAVKYLQKEDAAIRKRYRDNKSFGRAGESRAVDFLDRKGYEIIAQNYRCRFGEIDIVASEGDVLCFIEVKTRSSVRYGSPCQAVDRQKVLHIKRCAWSFLHQQGYIQHRDKLVKRDDRTRSFSAMRIEIIEVIYNEEKFYIRHLRDVGMNV